MKTAPKNRPPRPRAPHATQLRAPHPRVLLCILDGFGHGKDYKGNAITRAKTPFLTGLFKKYPWTLLHASGEHVGIPKGTQGGSEVGHLTMGAGRIVLQPLLEIDRAIADKSFFKKKELLAAIAHVKKHKSNLHLLGMISDQGVHADLGHALALLDLAKIHGLSRLGGNATRLAGKPRVFVHGITDGRDVPPKSAKKFIRKLLTHMKKIRTGTLATLIGRYYAMDRDKNFDRTEVAYRLLTRGETLPAKGASPLPKAAPAQDPLAAIDQAYAEGLESDYYLKPILLSPKGAPAKNPTKNAAENPALIHKNDAVIFWNFRTDRAQQLTDRFTSSAEPSRPALKPYFVAFGPYTTRAPVVFPLPKVKNNLGSVLDRHHLRQLRIGETEKYAHVTFFFNSQIKEPFPTEKRILVASPKCRSYAEKPEMSAPGITKALLTELKAAHAAKAVHAAKAGHPAKAEYAFIALNFANLDLVGHSADLKATIRAVEVIDRCLSKIVPAALACGFTVLITGDHGNAEYKLYPNGEPCPSHTRNPVPFIVITRPPKGQPPKGPPPLTLTRLSYTRPTGGLPRLGGGLKDIAPTILTLLGLPIPKEMTGESLI